MLSREDNELLCRVGPGTPMGNLMRQYWVPAALSSELPERDGAPVRIRLLGENLIAFRTTSGAVGLLQNHCPHRGTSLFFGRNEEEGLRCVYHGWKFDVTGACVDMPSEPAESNFKNKVRAKAYRTHERSGIIWAYMVPDEKTPPSLPELEANMLPEDQIAVTVLHRANNCAGPAGCRRFAGGRLRTRRQHARRAVRRSRERARTASGCLGAYHRRQACRRLDRRRARDRQNHTHRAIHCHSG